MSRLMFGDKELLDLTVKELKVELGKKDLKKKGRKTDLQERLRAALEKMAVSHCRLAVCSCELPRLHRERQRGKRQVKKRYGTVNYTVPAPVSTTNLVSHDCVRRQSLENSSG